MLIAISDTMYTITLSYVAGEISYTKYKEGREQPQQLDREYIRDCKHMQTWTPQRNTNVPAASAPS